MTSSIHLHCALLCVVACACAAPPAADPVVEVDDVRAPIPEPDARFVDIVSPEIRIEPGQEKIYCYYVDNPVGRFGTSGLVAIEALGRHHLSLRGATERRPGGTLEECTTSQHELQLGDLYVGPDLPAGWASVIPADAQFVLEMHYVNAGDLPLLVRDVLRVRRVPDELVEHWVYPMHIKTYDLVVPPGDATLAFECTTPAEELGMYLFWGHVHDSGTRVEVTMTPPGGAASRLYEWRREVDPEIRGSFDARVMLPASTRLRVMCSWRNTTGAEIRFPDEMCAFGGLVDQRELACTAPSFTP